MCHTGDFESPDWNSPTIERAPDFGRRKMDEQVAKSALPRILAQAICRRPEVPPELRKRLQKRRPINRKGLAILAQVAERAVFDIPTPNSLILNERVAPLKNHAYQLGVAATAVPSLSTPKGTLYLCLAVHRSLDGLRCRLAVVTLPVAGESRSVVVTGHLCDRISERAKLKGSPVAFVAKAVMRNEVVIMRQKHRREQLLTIRGWDDQVLGYCPLKEISCCLYPNERTSAAMRSFLRDQPRWLLKTFLLPEMVKLAM